MARGKVSQEQAGRADRLAAEGRNLTPPPPLPGEAPPDNPPPVPPGVVPPPPPEEAPRRGKKPSGAARRKALAERDSELADAAASGERAALEAKAGELRALWSALDLVLVKLHADPLTQPELDVLVSGTLPVFLKYGLPVEIVAACVVVGVIAPRGVQAAQFVRAEWKRKESEKGYAGPPRVVA